MTLPAFAAKCCCLLLINIPRPRGTEQQICCTPLLLLIDEADEQRDARLFHKPCTVNNNRGY